LSSAFFSTSVEIFPPLIMIATTLVLTSSCIAVIPPFLGMIKVMLPQLRRHTRQMNEYDHVKPSFQA